MNELNHCEMATTAKPSMRPNEIIMNELNHNNCGKPQNENAMKWQQTTTIYREALTPTPTKRGIKIENLEYGNKPQQP